MGEPNWVALSLKQRVGDIPINPGETGVREKRWPQSTKFTAEIQLLSFGDGTGYFGTRPYPPAEKRQALSNKPE
jgi:hypothetical protein